jgi:imidazolonepropionase-like amidohydrolase
MTTDGRFRILAGWMADGVGGPLQRDRFLEIEGNRLRRLGAAARGGQTFDLDLSDCLVLPGLIDAHVHLFMSGTAEPAVREWQLKAPFAEMRGVIQHRCERHLASGIAAVRDGGDYAAHTLRFKNERTHDGGPPLMLHAAGRAWRRAGRYGRLIGRPPAEGQALSQAVAWTAEKVDHVKIVNSGLNSLKHYGRETAPQFAAAELAAAVSAAKAADREVMVHANGEVPVRHAIAAGCRSIEHGFFMGEGNLVRLAETRIFWVPTAVTMQGYCRHTASGSLEGDVARRNLDHQLGQIRRAKALGVRIALGTDAGTIGVHHGSALREEIELLQAAGCTLSEAVQCATGRGAELLGIEGVGRIVAGCRATLLALPGGPHDFPASLCRPVWFMIDGRMVFDHRPTRLSGA